MSQPDPPALAAPPVVAQEDTLSSPMASALLLTLKAECEAQHARADAAEAQLHAEIENHREWYERATTQVTGLQAQLHAVQQIISEMEEPDAFMPEGWRVFSPITEKWRNKLKAALEQKR